MPSNAPGGVKVARQLGRNVSTYVDAALGSASYHDFPGEVFANLFASDKRVGGCFRLQDVLNNGSLFRIGITRSNGKLRFADRNDVAFRFSIINDIRFPPLARVYTRFTRRTCYS